ncbi:MAG TPA: DNA translocase FtsK 4TM domain-containing protein, partial [Acidimicrobiales bacterium]|nr:DNA translocase FtsK 4TM domain-containing protein [Acidimicrobiales bacterium]
MKGQSRDLWGLLLLLLAVLAALGLYSGAMGPAGQYLRDGAADGFGLARWVLPVALAVLGGYLVLGREGAQPGRVALGVALALASLDGLLQLSAGRDTVHQALRAFGKAGGIIGAGVGIPLRAGLSSWGAGLVCGAALLAALLIITATPVRTIAAGVRRVAFALARAGRWVLRAVGRRLGSPVPPRPEPAPSDRGPDRSGLVAGVFEHDVAGYGGDYGSAARPGGAGWREPGGARLAAYDRAAEEERDGRRPPVPQEEGPASPACPTPPAGDADEGGRVAKPHQLSIDLVISKPPPPA